MKTPLSLLCSYVAIPNLSAVGETLVDLMREKARRPQVLAKRRKLLSLNAALVAPRRKSQQGDDASPLTVRKTSLTPSSFSTNATLSKILSA